MKRSIPWLAEKDEKSFIKATKQAIAKGRETFTWNNHEFHTPFAKYVVEYLEGE